VQQLIDYEPVIGVDLAPDYIRATQVERVAGEYYLRNIGIIEMPPDCIEDGRIIRPNVVGRAIKELFRERKFESKKVVTAVRGKGVVSRIITLPSMPQERLRKLIEKEVERYVLFSEEDKVVYYYPIEEFDDHDRRKINIMLVVARKSLCRSYYEAFKAANLELISIDTSSFSIMRELHNSMPDAMQGNAMSLILDYQGLSMNIFSGDTLRFSRNVILDNNDVSAFSNGFVDRVIGEVLLAMNYYQGEYRRGDMLQGMVMSVGAEGGMEVFEHMKNAVGDVPVELHNPFGNIKLNIDQFPASIMEKVDSNFVTSVGLSLRGQELDMLPLQVDLLPPEITENKIFTQQRNMFFRYLLFIAVLLAGIYAFLSFTTRGVDNQLDRQTYKEQNVNNMLNQFKQKKLETMRLNPLDANAPVTMNMSPVFEEVKSVIPKNAQLTSMVIRKPDVVEFEGIAEDSPAVSDFMMALENSRRFFDPELGPRNVVNVFDRKMVSFVIRCHFREIK